MALHVVVGAGRIGAATALHLAELGHHVRVITRSGAGPDHERIEIVTADALDTEAIRRHATGAAALYNCVSPPGYQHWEQMWPRLASSLLNAAEATGAVLVIMSNLYGYGPVSGPISRDHPLAATEHKGRLRARLWHEALAAHEAGRVRVTEARASDFLGPAPRLDNEIITRYATAALRGKTVYMFGDPDAPRSWTFAPDVARTLAVLGSDERAWGEAWHVPSPPPVSPRTVVESAASLAGVAPPRIRRIPRAALQAAYPFSPLIREVGGVLYQWERPFEIDAEATTAEFGLRPTPWQDVLRSAVEYWQRDLHGQSPRQRR